MPLFLPGIGKQGDRRSVRGRPAGSKAQARQLATSGTVAAGTNATRPGKKESGGGDASWKQHLLGLGKKRKGGKDSAWMVLINGHFTIVKRWRWISTSDFAEHQGKRLSREGTCGWSAPEGMGKREGGGREGVLGISEGGRCWRAKRRVSTNGCITTCKEGGIDAYIAVVLVRQDIGRGSTGRWHRRETVDTLCCSCNAWESKT